MTHREAPRGTQDRPALPGSLSDKIDMLRGRPFEVLELAGGLTNRNLKVTTPEGACVVRISSPTSGALSINREHEFRNSVIAAASGVGAPVLSYLPEEAALVIGYIEGRTLTDDDFSTPGAVERVAASCRRLHDGARFVNDFDMFDTQRRYLRLVRARGYRLPAGYLDFEPDVERIRGALAIRLEPTVACNNDLLAANLIDDGDQIRIIDYEYSGNNDACFELGNIGSECHLTDDQLDHLVASYYGRRLANKIARARLLGLMSQYGWTLWASIQQATSDIDFDFWPWGLEKYERAVETFRGPLLDRLVEDVQRDD
ncbi:MAG TPA: choline/ethanolamine kinase family protein [Acidimicrobiales bacterium]|nr:choline/ethanolamine kinase family protein [Acidimicrobiales bacterium]